MRILVTGARSFTARFLLPLLQGRGEIIGTGVEDPSVDGVRFLTADLTRPATVTDMMREANPDLIVHLAGVAGSDPGRCVAVNLEGTRNLVRSLSVLPSAPRFLFVSSAAVYGRIRPDETPVTEDTPLRPAGPYAESKAGAELLVRDCHRQGLARVVTVRPFNLVGPGLPRGLAPSDFAAEVRRVKRGESESVIRVGTLTPTRDFVDVRDAVRAYLLLAEHPEAYGRVVNIGSGQGTSIGDLLQQMMRLAGVEARVETDPARLRAVDVPEIVADLSALRKLIPWQPEIALDRSLRDMIEEP